MIEKCKKHHKPIINPVCKINHYGDDCCCIYVCEVCVSVSKKAHDKMMSKCNYVTEVSKNPHDVFAGNIKVSMFKFKPRNRLKKGDYAILDMNTGYLVKATTAFVQFYVIK